MPIRPEEIPARMRDLLRRAGLSLAKFAHLIDMEGGSSVQRYTQEGRRKYIDPELVERMADALEGRSAPGMEPIKRIEVLEMAGEVRINSPARNNRVTSEEISLAERNLSPYGLPDLPLWGRVRAGDGTYIFENGASIQAFTARPVELVGNKEAYAVYVHGESMEPVFKHGTKVYVDPTRPVAPGDDVVIQLTNDQGFIKRLVRRTARTVLCTQYNGDQEIEFATSEVRAIHLIILGSRVRV